MNSQGELHCFSPCWQYADSGLLYSLIKVTEKKTHAKYFELYTYGASSGGPRPATSNWPPRPGMANLGSCMDLSSHQPQPARPVIRADGNCSS